MSPGQPSSRQPKRQHNLPSFRSRRTTPPSAQGRWSLVPSSLASPTEWSHAFANQLLNRYGVLTRESAASENLPGGFSAIYDVLKAMEESGRIRRGYFVAGLGATQFALPAAVDLLRSLRNGPPLEKPEMVTLAATDPANLYGSVLRWPAQDEAKRRRSASLTRSAGASVVLRNGELVAYLRRNNPNLQVFLPAMSRSAQRLRATSAFFSLRWPSRIWNAAKISGAACSSRPSTVSRRRSTSSPPSCRMPVFILPRKASIFAVRCCRTSVRPGGAPKVQ